jgi:chromosome segregation ATPase
VPFVTLAEANLIDEAHPSDSNEDTVSLGWQEGQEDNDHPIEEAIEANGDQIATLREMVEEVRQSLDQRKGSLEDYESTIEALQSKMEEATDTIQSNHEALGGHNNRIHQLEAEREELKDLAATLDAVEDQVDDLSESLDTVEEQTGHLNGNVAVLRTAVFNESRPCPECSTGTLDLKTPVARPKRVTCDSCDFEVKTTIS